MGSEKALWRMVRRIADGEPRADFTRIEDALAAGVPDVNWCIQGVEGWLELKHVPKWPARPTSRVDVGLRPSQRDWLKDRWRCGGNAYVLAQVGREYFLFRGADADAICEKPRRAELEALALKHYVASWDLRDRLLDNLMSEPT